LLQGPCTDGDRTATFPDFDVLAVSYFVFSGLYCLPIFIAVDNPTFQQPPMFIQKKQAVALHDLPPRNHVEVVVEGQRGTPTETEAGHAYPRNGITKCSSAKKAPGESRMTITNSQGLSVIDSSL
jgi:hypothetical protein